METNTEAGLDKVFAVWPEDSDKNPEQMQAELNAEMNRYQSKAQDINQARLQGTGTNTKAGDNETSAFDVFLNSEKSGYCVDRCNKKIFT